MLINLILFFGIICIVLYVVNQALPMPNWIKVVINALVALVVIVWLLQLAGFTGGWNLGRWR